MEVSSYENILREIEKREKRKAGNFTVMTKTLLNRFSMMGEVKWEAEEEEEETEGDLDNSDTNSCSTDIYSQSVNHSCVLSPRLANLARNLETQMLGSSFQRPSMLKNMNPLNLNNANSNSNNNANSGANPMLALNSCPTSPSNASYQNKMADIICTPRLSNASIATNQLPDSPRDSVKSKVTVVFDELLNESKKLKKRRKTKLESQPNSARPHYQNQNLNQHSNATPNRHSSAHEEEEKIYRWQKRFNRAEEDLVLKKLRLGEEEKYAPDSPMVNAKKRPRRATISECLNDARLGDELDLSGRDLVVLPLQAKCLNHVKSLDASKNSILDLPVWISGFTSLTQLDLSYNNLMGLPKCIGNMKALEDVNLSHNHMEFFPSALLELEQIRKLDINSNYLSVLPAEISRLDKLEYLNVGKNTLIHIPSEIKELKSLQVVNIGGNNLMVTSLSFLAAMPHIKLEEDPSQSDIIDYTGTSGLLLDTLQDPNHISFDSNAGKFPETLDPNDYTAEELEEIRRNRSNVVDEIVQSERRYVKYLNALYEVFYLPLTKTEHVISKEEATKIFPPGFISVLEFSRKMLQELESRVSLSALQSSAGKAPAGVATSPDDVSQVSFHQVKVGDIFFEWAPYFKVYVLYIQHYDACIKNMHEVLDRNPFLKEYLRVCQKNPRCDGLGLNSFLIMPIQRIPRYRMLLEQLLQQTLSNHPDHQMLCQAVPKVVENATYVNQRIREISNRMRVKELQQSLKIQNLVQPHRTLVLEGNVGRVYRSATANKLLSHVTHLFLFNDMIIYYTPKKLSRKCRVVDLKGASIHVVEEIENCLVLVVGNKDIKFIAKNANDLSTWVLNINNVITGLGK